MIRRIRNLLYQWIKPDNGFLLGKLFLIPAKR